MDCDLGEFFDSITLSDGAKLWFAKGRDDRAVPLIYCPFCGTPLYSSEKKEE